MTLVQRHLNHVKCQVSFMKQEEREEEKEKPEENVQLFCDFVVFSLVPFFEFVNERVCV